MDSLVLQFLIYSTQIPHQTAPKPGFQQTHTTHDGMACSLRQPPRRAFVQKSQIGMENICQPYSGQFSCAQSVPGTERKHLCW